MKLKPVPLMFLTFKSTSVVDDKNFYWFHFLVWIIEVSVQIVEPENPKNSNNSRLIVITNLSLLKLKIKILKTNNYYYK